MRNFNRFNAFSSVRIKSYLTDQQVRELVRRHKNKLEYDLSLRQDKPLETGLCGVHIFSGVNRQRDIEGVPPASEEEIARRDQLYGSLKSTPSSNKTNQAPKGALMERWINAKNQLSVQFAKLGNQPFIDEAKHDSRRGKRKAPKRTKGGRSKVKSTYPTDTLAEIS